MTAERVQELDSVEVQHKQHFTPTDKDQQGPQSLASDFDGAPNASHPFKSSEYALRKSKQSEAGRPLISKPAQHFEPLEDIGR